MLKYITENEYVELLGVESVPNNFDNLVIEASAYINKQTYGRIDIDNIPEQVKYVTCLIINLIIEYKSKKEEIGALKSQNVEGWQESYQDTVEIDKEFEKNKYNTLKEYLNNDLLYRGV